MSELERVNENPEFREYMSAEEDNLKIENSLKREWKESGINESKIEIAKSLLKNKVDIQIIIDSTGLSKVEIEKLK